MEVKRQQKPWTLVDDTMIDRIGSDDEEFNYVTYIPVAVWYDTVGGILHWTPPGRF